MPRSLLARLGLGAVAALVLLGLVMLLRADDDPRYKKIPATKVAAQTGVQLPDRSYGVQARQTIKGEPWTAVSFHVEPDQYAEALVVNHVVDLHPGLVVLKPGDDLGLEWRPNSARRVAGTSDRLPDGRVRRIQVMWGKTMHRGHPANPQICIVIAGP